jgi:hypothetical protein
MANRRWFYMPAETFESARASCEHLHRAQYPDEELWMIWNNDMTACLVCLDGASKDWRAIHEWIGNCVEVYCRTTYPGLSEIPAAGEWQLPPESLLKNDGMTDDLTQDDLWGVD